MSRLRLGSALVAAVILAPGLLGPAYFKEIAEVAAAAAGGPPGLAAIGAVMSRHGLSPARPAGSSVSIPQPAPAGWLSLSRTLRLPAASPG